jgi:hypothetical protein
VKTYLAPSNSSTCKYGLVSYIVIHVICRIQTYRTMQHCRRPYQREGDCESDLYRYAHLYCSFLFEAIGYDNICCFRSGHSRRLRFASATRYPYLPAAKAVLAATPSPTSHIVTTSAPFSADASVTAAAAHLLAWKSKQISSQIQRTYPYHEPGIGRVLAARRSEGSV